MLMNEKMKYTRRGSLQDLGTTEQDSVFVSSIYVKVVALLEELDRLFQQGRRLSRKHRFVDNDGAIDE
jgi:hypothetical protein